MNKKTVVVTGGAGYIGSFICRQLASEGYTPVVVDDLSSGHREAVKDYELYTIEIDKDPSALTALFSKLLPVGVIHMASFIQMGESFRNPGKYFRNNLLGAVNVLEAMKEAGVPFVIFSSSAGVYGNPERLPIEEDSPKRPENPYGETKLMIERCLYWYEKAYDLRYVSIRYFNAAGASSDGSIGEDHPNESHIIPLIIRSQIEDREFTIFGGDYSTKDGTCVRDYVHVEDLAKAHTMALGYLLNGGESTEVNAGSGVGYSNKEIIEAVEEVSGKNVKVRYGERREGDADSLYASIAKIEKMFGWKPERDLMNIIETAYKWHSNNPGGYKS